MMLDLVIRNGRIIDGSGKPTFEGDIGIAGDRIAAVGRIDSRGVAEIDAAGDVVAPGFIDIHSHSDYTLLVDPRAVSAVHQGVTLEVLGNCGFGCAPIRDAALAAGSIYGFDGSLPLTWRTIGQYLDALAAARPAVNVLTLVPNGQLRRHVLGVADRPANSDETRSMAALLEASIDEGAFGLSTGLEYVAERGASEDEVGELCRIVKKRDALYATHTRRRDEGAIEAIEEALRVGRRTGVRLQISHLLPRKVADQEGERALALVDAARGAGQDVGFDMHTRLFGTTYLDTIVPPWAHEGGAAALRRHLQSSESRRRMRDFPSIVAGGGWDRVVLLDHPAYPELARRSVGEAARELRRDAHDLAFDIVLAELGKPIRPMVIIKTYCPEDQAAIFSHPLCVPGSDATTLAPDGPLAHSSFHGAYSWAAWFFRFMVRERRRLSAEEAVRRLTGLPASILRLADRGSIREGARADIAVFDPEKLGETTTTFEPNRLATGMRHVIVNGVPTLQDGTLTGNRGGQVLRYSTA